MVADDSGRPRNRAAANPAARNRAARPALRAGILLLVSWGGLGPARLAVPAARAAEGPPAPASQVTPTRLRNALAQLDGLAADLMRRSGVPGMSVVVVHDDRVVYLRGFGVLEAGQPARVDGDTVFQLASLSKPIASTVVAAVVGDGRVGFDDPVLRTLPEARIGPPAIASSVTLRDLLSHRSGLPDHAGDHLEDIGFDRETILRRLRLIPIENRFRAVYNYTNFGFTAGAVAAARAAGQDWETLSAQRLYRPLGMARTTSRFSEWMAMANRARPHVPDGGRWVARYQRDPQAQAPAGGVSSSARDLGQWLRLQLAGGRVDGRQLVAATALAETHRPQMISTPPKNPSQDHAGLYGLGWGVGYTNRGEVQLSHSGAFNLGAATAVYLLPEEKLGIVALTNAQPVGLPESLALSFLDLASRGAIQQDYLPALNRVFQAMGSQDYPQVVAPAAPTPALAPQAYAGRYRNAYVGPIAVRHQEGQGLMLELGPAPLRFPLTHVSGHTFRYQPIGENAYGPSAVVFSIGSGGSAEALRIDNLNLNGLGTFRRE